MPLSGAREHAPQRSPRRALRSVAAAAAVAAAVAAGLIFRERASVDAAPRAGGGADPPASGGIAPSAEALVPRTPLPGSDASPPAAGEDEPSLMGRLRATRGKDRPATIDLARGIDRRFPGSADAPERASILVHALAEEGRASESRGEAERVVNSLPDSPWVREIEQFTGAHRHRNIQVTADGGLEYY